MKSIRFCHNIKLSRHTSASSAAHSFGNSGLEQWFLTFFTYLTLSSNKITRFTPDTLSGAHVRKMRNLHTLTVQNGI